MALFYNDIISMIKSLEEENTTTTYFDLRTYEKNSVTKDTDDKADRTPKNYSLSSTPLKYLLPVSSNKLDKDFIRTFCTS
ncbi:MAG: hypothetical protein IPK46_09010 [Saprospiraceae bacterium]|nr:hypothetical protein [Saprospiraceae bacterium]